MNSREPVLTKEKSFLVLSRPAPKQSRTSGYWVIRTFLHAGIMGNGMISPSEERVRQKGPLRHCCPTQSGFRDLERGSNWTPVEPPRRTCTHGGV